jgi:hypothetical protein
MQPIRHEQFAHAMRHEPLQRAAKRSSRRAALAVAGVVAFAVAALAVVPRGFDAQWQLVAQDDPVQLADRALAQSFDAAVAARQIEDALAADDADLAQSFLELAQDRGVAVEPALADKVKAANDAAASAARTAASFARGLITGEPDDLVGLAGTALGDLFVFGDIRDAVREGTRLVTGEETDQLILGLSCVGLAITAGTYATLGAGAPARVGLSVVKAARRTGRLSSHMADWIGRSLRDVVDWGSLRRAGSVSLTDPAMAVRAAREAVKVEKAGGLVELAKNVGRVQTKSGTQAALDGLKISRGPRDMARMARLADAKGGKTRAIVKLLGRGAIALTTGAFSLAMWLFWAALMLFGFVSSLKSAVERMTQRHICRRKVRRARDAELRLAGLPLRL